MPVPEKHFVNGNPLVGPWPEGFETAVFGLGCFWGAERKFWETNGVYSTSVGYAGGFTPNATYEETCSGLTGHAEVVQVVFDPSVVSFDQLLQGVLGEPRPDPGDAPGKRHGDPIPQRDLLHLRSAARGHRRAHVAMYQQRLSAAGFGEITTEVEPLGEFYYAEPYHQQYLAKNPNGYCGIGGTGVSCPIGLTA